MELNQVHRTSCVGLYVNSSTDYRMRLVHEQEKQQTRKEILNPLSNKLPKAGVNSKGTRKGTHLRHVMPDPREPLPDP